MSGFLARVTSLGVATAAGQVMVALNLIIVARLLTQSDVGHYSVFLSYAMILLPVSLLSYEVLLPNVEEEEIATLLHGILPLAGTVAGMSALGFAASGYPHALPLAALLLGMAVLRLVEFAAIRAQRVQVIGLARTLPHFGFMLLLAGLAYAGTVDLETVLWTQVTAFAASALLLARLALTEGMSRKPDWQRTLRLLRDRWRNPILFAPSEIASTAAWNLPVVLVARNFGEAMAAQYGVMLRYVMAPVGLMNSVIGNVYHADLARAMRERDPAMRERFRFIRRRMLMIGLLAGTATALLLPPLLHLLLGPGWEIAQDLVLVMAPLVAVAVWISPFGVSFYVFERSWELLLLNLAYVLIAVAAFSLVTGALHLAVGLFVALAMARFLVMLMRVERMMRVAGEG